MAFYGDRYFSQRVLDALDRTGVLAGQAFVVLWRHGRSERCELIMRIFGNSFIKSKLRQG